MTTTKKVIDDKTFKCVPFKTMEALKLQNKLAKIFLPALSQLLGIDGKETPKDIMDMNINGDAIATAAQNIFSELDENEMENLFNRLLRGVTVEFKGDDGKLRAAGLMDDGVFDLVFQTRTTDVYKIIWWVLKENYPDFFAMWRGGIAKKIVGLKKQEIK